MKIIFVIVCIIAIAYFIIANKTKKIGVIEISLVTAKEMIKDPQIVILDVRSSQEFNRGYIEGARNIPVAELEKRINELEAFKNHKILVYCHAGSRSSAASIKLVKYGFPYIYNLKAGISEWVKSGNPAVKPH